MKMQQDQPKICFYISSHGFGHSTREIEVIAHIPNDITVEIITAAPKWLFEKSLSRPFEYTYMNHDSGIIQPDSFTQDLQSTWNTWDEILRLYPQRAKEEALRLQNQNVKVIAGDISPFAVAVANELGVPSIIIANFSWDWIFSDFLANMPQFASIIDAIKGYYNQAGLLLRTPLSDSLDVFPRIIDIPLITRKSKHNKAEIRRLFGIPADTRTALISFGGMGCNLLQPQMLAQFADILFLTFDCNLAKAQNAILLDPQSTYHPDAICASDIALSKLGYGMVSECIAHRTPVAYPPRKNFLEHEILAREISRYVPSFQLSEEAFFSGQWNFLNHAFAAFKSGEGLGGYENSPGLNGGEIAAEKLCQYCR